MVASDRPALEVEITPDEAAECLARRLHWKMEHLDLTEDPEWDRLNDRQKEFYRACVEWLLLKPDLIRVAMG